MGVRFEGVTYRYEEGGAPVTALSAIGLAFEPGRFTAVVGAPGSGKSTLLQHMNGLLTPSEGIVRIGELKVEPDTPERMMGPIRRRVGLVFQYPERQMFEETVLRDLMFGPLNFGLTPEDAERAARTAAARLGLDEAVLAASPFRLSSGQLRKAAIAAVLAADPDVFVLDEPTASLDPHSRREVTALLASLCRDDGKTLVVVTHRLDEVLPYADDLVVMQGGRTVCSGPAERVAADRRALEAAGVPLPAGQALLAALADDGAPLQGAREAMSAAAGAEEAAAAIAAWLRGSAGAAADGASAPSNVHGASLTSAGAGGAAGHAAGSDTGTLPARGEEGPSCDPG